MSTQDPDTTMRSWKTWLGRLWNGVHDETSGMKISTALKLFWEAVQGWSRDNVPRLGASLAYYSLFSVAPVLVIVIAIAGSVFGPEAVRGEIAAQVDDLIGTQGGERRSIPFSE